MKNEAYLFVATYIMIVNMSEKEENNAIFEGFNL